MSAQPKTLPLPPCVVQTVAHALADADISTASPQRSARVLAAVLQRRGWKPPVSYAESPPPNPAAWRGIESAPRDGSRCIGVNRSRIVGEVYFDRFGDERWHWTDGTLVATLTAWQPLPAPPADEVGE